MKLNVYYPALFLMLLAAACRQTPAPPQPKNEAPAVGVPQPPDVQYGALFEAVQMARVFPDGKTFADCTPKMEPADILKKYEAEKSNAGFDLKTFVTAHFDPPVAHSSGFTTDPGRSAEQHIEALWPVLTRPADTVHRGTLLPLPNPYVVPGGRFGEIYYWDSYFTMLGLQASGRNDLINNMIANFAFLIDTYGHIPNGNRSYYLSRSQPPYFSLMTELAGSSAQYLPQLEKEYLFWMDGLEKLDAQYPARRRVVRLSDGAYLNRYWDDLPAPRPESYREDVETAVNASARPKEEVYRQLKAGAESGWDFSSRWFADLKTLETIRVTEIVPVDLNCLMWHLENTLAKTCTEKGETAKAEIYKRRAEDRAAAIKSVFYDARLGFFSDYDLKNNKTTGVPTLAGMFPLFFQLAEKKQAFVAVKTLEQTLLRPGGLVTTPYKTGQQWDAPNGWAPLQWIGIVGLRNYGYKDLAETAKQRWIKLNVDVYKRTGKMLEKYNVEDLSLEAGGGEYPVQDGFGWTNGVLLKLLKEK